MAQANRPLATALGLIALHALGTGLAVGLFFVCICSPLAPGGEPFTTIGQPLSALGSFGATTGLLAGLIAASVWLVLLWRAGLGAAWCVPFIASAWRTLSALAIVILLLTAAGAFGSIAAIESPSIDWIPVRPNIERASNAILVIGAAAMLVVGAALWWSMTALRRLGAAMEREIAAHCPRCWYPRTPTGTCPECGADTTAPAVGDPPNPAASTATCAQ